MSLALSPGRWMAQSRVLTPRVIDSALSEKAPLLALDPLRPAFHLTPPAGCMGDPNGGIYHQGWYHIFCGLYPFAHHPGGWYWAHAKSRDLLHWTAVETGLTPAFELGLSAVGSGSTMVQKGGKRLAFHSANAGKGMAFWQAEFTNDDLSQWVHPPRNPVLTLDSPGLPPFDGFWRDPFVFSVGERTFLIACADLLEEDHVPVPIFEARTPELVNWDYRGNLFTYPKRKLRNLEVPEFRKLGDKWIFLASADAPVDRCVYFIGAFDLDRLKFTIEQEGVLDYSGHYYAQETIEDEDQNLFVMAWVPGWDREWLPTYMNAPLKNDHSLWNGCFALPRLLSLDAQGRLQQEPLPALKALRSDTLQIEPRLLPVDGPFAAYHLVEELRGREWELEVELDLHHASFCGLNFFSDSLGMGGLYLIWTGERLVVDGVSVNLEEWQPGQTLKLRISLDRQLVEVFAHEGRYCISRKVAARQIKGDHVALTSLGGTAKLASMRGWKMRALLSD